MKYKDVLGEDFKTKKEAYRHFCALRDKVTEASCLGRQHLLTEETIVKKSQMDKLYADYFLCKDPNWYKKKIGRGVKDWFFGRDKEGGVCLWVLQKEDPKENAVEESIWSRLAIKETDMPFSISAKWVFTCFGPGVMLDKSPRLKIKNVLRHTVKPQIQEFRDSVEDKCQSCGKQSSGLGLEVDHTPNFSDIAESFLNRHDQNFLTETVIDLETKRVGANYPQKWRFNDVAKQIKKDWCEYHESQAVLRLLCVSCHKSKTHSKES